MFPGARWVKAFNSVYFKTLESEAHRSGDRLGIPLAGDDRDALEVASRLVRDAGFDPVIVGDLARGREFEPNTPPYNTGMSGEKLRQYFRITSAGGGERGFVPGTVSEASWTVPEIQSLKPVGFVPARAKRRRRAERRG